MNQQEIIYNNSIYLSPLHEGLATLEIILCNILTSLPPFHEGLLTLKIKHCPLLYVEKDVKLEYDTEIRGIKGVVHPMYSVIMREARFNLCRDILREETSLCYDVIGEVLKFM